MERTDTKEKAKRFWAFIWYITGSNWTKKKDFLLGATRITGQSWKKGRLPLSVENAGTSAAEDIDLDEDNGKYMMTGKE
ncbi:hypothetical protein Tco_1570511 [Tanacetum coccineum]